MELGAATIAGCRKPANIEMKSHKEAQGMGFLDQISKTLSQGVDRAKFEAEKFQKTTKLQGELNDLKRQVDEKMIEMGQRAYDLHRAGQISASSIAELAQTVDQLRASLVVKEEELKKAQVDVYIEPARPSGPTAQSVPITHEQPGQYGPSSASTPEAATKNCPTCNFQMPGSAVFCPNCGSRVGF
jgi:ssDNA-binding Zn-finger/Zn-ribbon topoisomerase 1